MQPEPKPKQGSVRVTLHPHDPRSHELADPSFTRYFPDLTTYERVRQHSTWDYIAIEVWTRQGEQWKPDAAHTNYTGLWRGDKITDPPEGNEQRQDSLTQEDVEHRRHGYGGE